MLALACAAALPRAARAASAPALMLAEVYRPGVPLDAYWVSEKYDGVRAYWNGRQLITRGGEVVAAPAWFTARWPATPMDGELWAGRGRFEMALSTVRRQAPDEEAWRRVRYMVFDLPSHAGPFTERIAAYHGLVQQIDEPWVQAVPQERVISHAALMARLDRVVRDGGEGLMLHRADAPYRALRSDDLLKVKTHDDAEARVIAHLPGKGRHEGRLGALLVETPQGVRFRLGTGLSDAQRDNPPPIGTWVTYRYRGVNASGVPRFASFLRQQPDGPAR
ncbi:DNA ligase [Hydrogenophaga sp.]|uniref:DNA ligase n=1 Tax=Hydrogenophaga sp. TaxID=1904254 RepID=UPI00262D9316|nr:DNA ligase [Hydrogenophaga sp.]